MKGAYLLLIQLKKDTRIRIGKLGVISFKEGYYLYVGSALNGLDQRIRRHIRKQKKNYWHIDYFLDSSQIISVYYKESVQREECSIAHTFETTLYPISGFGCSDCNCRSHLFFGSYEEIMEVVDILHMKKYHVK
jgi:Uri superfamily endonuclease